MKNKLAKFLIKPKSPIGLSLLDVISNALASIILLFFVMVAIRSQPPPPERQVGMLMVDFIINTPSDSPTVVIYLKSPETNSPYLFDDQIQEQLPTPPEIDSIKGIWDQAVVLTSLDNANKFRRIFYMNPEKGEQNKWHAGIIYSDHTRFTYKDFKTPATVQIKGYFISKGTMTLDTFIHSAQVLYPTQKFEVEFSVPDYSSENNHY